MALVLMMLRVDQDRPPSVVITPSGSPLLLGPAAIHTFALGQEIEKRSPTCGVLSAAHICPPSRETRMPPCSVPGFPVATKQIVAVGHEIATALAIRSLDARRVQVTPP